MKSNTQPMKSTLYKRYYFSKKEYPTRIVKQGINSGVLQIGHVAAKRKLESRLGRTLDNNFKVKTKGGNWCFEEKVNGRV